MSKKKSNSDGSDSGEENLSKKDLALKQALDQITTSFGKGSIMWLGRLPKGRVIEIYGPEASGKTTLALHVIAEAQKQGGYCCFVDAEHALNPTLAVTIGVNTANLLLLNQIVVAAFVPKGELEGEMGDAHMAMQARLMSQALRKLSHSLSLSQTILIFINQVRSKLSTFGGFGGPSEVTCGGNALKFYASVRLNIKRIGLVKKGEETIGSQVLVKIVKNKHAPPFRTAEFELEFGKGISLEAELIDLGVKHKFITKGGGGYYSINNQSLRGRDAVKQFLSENTSAREDLMMKFREKLVDGGDKDHVDPVDEVVLNDTTDEDAATAVEA
ncbi:hypothetical protein K7X08_030190 [Anisodus acutangulus]|uniref:RecA family profile 2 domain-containing protein n=1 Tax=Anisodus acutangulus TaxID=402998 RepID=A0A9Q1LQU6_9SOLA|nr:hypothetical protein K7X08_030190 [Anisodus acutangulus]